MTALIDYLHNKMVRPVRNVVAEPGNGPAAPADKHAAAPADKHAATPADKHAAAPADKHAAGAPSPVEEWFGQPVTFRRAIRGIAVDTSHLQSYQLFDRLAAISTPIPTQIPAPVAAAPAPRDDGAARRVVRVRRPPAGGAVGGAAGGSVADWELVAPLAGCLFAGDGGPNPPEVVRAMSNAVADAVGRPNLSAAARRIYLASQTPRALASATVATAIAMGRQFFCDAIATPELFEFAAISAPDPNFFAELFEFD